MTPREAQDQLQLLLADLVINPPPPPPKPTVSFEVAVDEWLRYVEYDRERAPTTVRDYRNTAYNQLVPHFGAERLVNTITTDDIDAYREQRLAEGRLARRTLQKHMVILHAIFKRAKRRKWVRVQPGRRRRADHVQAFRRLQTSSRRRRSIRWPRPPPTSS